MARSNLVHSASVQSESSFMKRKLSKATSVGGDYHLRTPQLDDARSGTLTLVRQNACERTSPIHVVSLSSDDLSNSPDVRRSGRSDASGSLFRRAVSTDLHHLPIVGFFSLAGNEPISLTGDCVRLLDFLSFPFFDPFQFTSLPPLSFSLSSHFSLSFYRFYWLRRLPQSYMIYFKWGFSTESFVFWTFAIDLVSTLNVVHVFQFSGLQFNQWNSIT